MGVESKRDFIIKVLYILTILGIIYVVAKYVIWWVFPFLLGLLIAFVLKPASSALMRRTFFKRKGSGFIVVLLFYGLIFTLLWFLISFLIGLFADFVMILPGIYQQDLLPLLSQGVDFITQQVNNLSPEKGRELSTIFNNALGSLTSMVTGLSASLLTMFKNAASRIPGFFLAVLFTILCSVFITMDYDRVSQFLQRQLPPKVQDMLKELRTVTLNTVAGMVRAYLILLFLAFIQMCIGFLILGVENWFVIAALLALFDLLPLLGVGGVLVPWAIISLFQGNYSLGIGLFVIYGVIYIMRNTLEPKIVGEQIGLPPLANIVAMYVGYKLLGFIGFFVAPFVAILLKYLNDNGVIHLYK